MSEKHYHICPDCFYITINEWASCPICPSDQLFSEEELVELSRLIAERKERDNENSTSEKAETERTEAT